MLLLLILFLFLYFNIMLMPTLEGGSNRTLSFTAQVIKDLIPANCKIALDTEWVDFSEQGQTININRCKAYSAWKKLKNIYLNYFFHKV